MSSDSQVVDTLVTDKAFTVNISGATVTLASGADETATVIAVDIQGTNGVVHVIDHVLLPAE